MGRRGQGAVPGRRPSLRGLRRPPGRASPAAVLSTPPGLGEEVPAPRAFLRPRRHPQQHPSPHAGPKACQHRLPGSAAGLGERPEATAVARAGAQDALPGSALLRPRWAPPSAPPLHPPRLLLRPRCPAPSPLRLSHKEQEMAAARVSGRAPLRGRRVPDLQPGLPPRESQPRRLGRTCPQDPSGLGTTPAAVGGLKIWAPFGPH